MKVFVTILGAVLVLAAWQSVMRTVLVPCYRSSLAARSTTRIVATLVSGVARGLRPAGKEGLLGLVTPVTLFALPTIWLVATLAGFALIAWGSSQVGLGASALASFFLLRQAHGSNGSIGSVAIPLAALAWLSSALVLTAFTTYLIRVTDAYSRRERRVIRLAAQATRPPDAETLIASYLRTGSRDHLGSMLGGWAEWLADVEGTHLGYPPLLHYRPAGELGWVKAAMIVLDCAALTQACAPDWAPPDTSAVLAAGCQCLQGIAANLGIELPPVPASHHGRETSPFDGTIAKVRDAGLPLELSEDQAQASFQRIRVQYAPFANAIAERLFCDFAAKEGRKLRRRR